jgi:predicted permease
LKEGETVNGFFQDLRYAFRTLAKAPGFTAVVVATLSLGIGANTAIFTVVRGVLLKSLPYREPDRLVQIGHVRPEGALLRGTFSPQDFDDLARERPGFSSLAAYQFVPGLTGMNLSGKGEPVRVQACYVSADFFETLGVSPVAGRALRPEENVPGRDRVAVVSQRLRAGALAGADGTPGRTVLLNGKPFTIAGVMPRSFQFPAPEVDLWVPVSLMGEVDVPHRRGVRWLEAVGRLAPGATLGQARAGTTALFAMLEKENPESNRGFGGALVVPLEKSLLGEVRTPLLVLLAAVCLVLLIACANVANLLLARATARRREIAIRMALGARPGRIARQLLTESAVLALLGGGLGLLAAQWGVDGLLALTGGRIPRADQVRPDAAMAAFALGVSLLTGILFGLLPALRAIRPQIAPALEAGGRTGTGARRDIRRALVVAETVLAALLLTGAGLLAKSFWRLIEVPSGLRAERVLAISLTLPTWKYPELEREEAYRSELLRRLRAIPGVVVAGGSKTMPLSGGGEAYRVALPGRSAPSDLIQPASGVIIVTPGYFDALGITLLQGRDFTERDIDTKAPVIVVNRALARQLWPGQDPVGKTLMFGPRARYEVIGVAADVRHGGLRQSPGGAIYGPISHFPRSSLKIFLRTAGDPLSVAQAARAAIRSFEPDQAISDVVALPQAVSETVARPRFYAWMLGIFAALALLLAGSGLYAVTSYGIEQRTREIGVRMALGADRRRVLFLVVSEALKTSAVGLALGLVLSAAAGRLLGGLLFGVQPFDPAVLASVAFSLLAASLLASSAPALRAARVDPIEALRAP